jgi:fumarylacetoacetase
VDVGAPRSGHVTGTWVDVPDGSPFTIDNLPYGIFSTPGTPPRAGAAIGDHVLDLAPVLDDAVWAAPSLNAFMALGPAAWRSARARLLDVLTAHGARGAVTRHLLDRDAVTMHLPFEVADYADFYSSLSHAENCGRILRPGTDPLTPNWRHMPIGYHGRAGTVVVSGTGIRRPSGQRRRGPGEPPSFGPSEMLDIEAEVGFVIGVPSHMGQRVGTEDFAAHVFGVVLLNDWSARDLQAWEGQPLGPFLGKSFATSASAWVVPLEALAPARLPAPAQEPPPLPYLVDRDGWALDMSLEVALNGSVISRPPFSSMYWTPAQQLAHLTVNGASLRTGDLFGSGTVSGPSREEWGSLLELTWGGRDTVDIGRGASRRFLEDGDRVVITATAPGVAGARIGLGPVEGSVVPAH